MIIYEGDDYLIKSPLSFFIGDLDDFILNYDAYLSTTDSIILQITMENWEYSPAPLAGTAGRRFYINGRLFLETTDRIS